MKKKIGELLVESGATADTEISAALALQRLDGSRRRLGELLVSAGKISPAALAQALAAQCDLPFTELPSVSPEAAKLVSTGYQVRNRLVAFRLESEGKTQRLLLAVDDPSSLRAVEDLRTHLRHPVKVFMATTVDLENALSAVRGERPELLDRALPGRAQASPAPVTAPGPMTAPLPAAAPTPMPATPTLAPAPLPASPVAPAPGAAPASPAPASLTPPAPAVSAPGQPEPEPVSLDDVIVEEVRDDAPAAQPAAVVPPPPPPDDEPVAAADAGLITALPFEASQGPAPVTASAPPPPPPAREATQEVPGAKAEPGAEPSLGPGSAPATVPPPFAEVIIESAGDLPPIDPPAVATALSAVDLFGEPPDEEGQSRAVAPAPVPFAPGPVPPAIAPLPASLSLGFAPGPVPPAIAPLPAPLAPMIPPLPVPPAAAPAPHAKAPAAAPKEIEFSDEDLKVLDGLERLASGAEPLEESEKVKPARMVASLIRLLIKKNVVTELEFLDELSRK